MKALPKDLRYLLFDLDGTLTDSAEGILRCVQYALEQCGTPEPDAEKLRPFIGPPLLDSFQEFCGMPPARAAFAVEQYRKRFSTVGLLENAVYDGIPELLEKLREHGYVLAVATSKPEVYTLRILEHLLQKVSGQLPDSSNALRRDIIVVDAAENGHLFDKPGGQRFCKEIADLVVFMTRIAKGGHRGAGHCRVSQAGSGSGDGDAPQMGGSARNHDAQVAAQGERLRFQGKAGPLRYVSQTMRPPSSGETPVRPRRTGPEPCLQHGGSYPVPSEGRCNRSSWGEE